jgi:hypothetical protein
MSKTEQSNSRNIEIPRRDVLKAAGLGAGAGLMAGLATPAAAAEPSPDIWSAEYWANKGGV